MKIAFGKMATIGMVHGKMKSEEKDKMMKEFEQGSISILISTFLGIRKKKMHKTAAEHRLQNIGCRA